MKKKLDIVLRLAAAAVLLLLLAAILYKQTSGALVIGTIRGAEWEYLTVEETEYAFDPAPPVHGTDKGAFLGIATSGDLRFRIYSSSLFRRVPLTPGLTPALHCIGSHTEIR